MPRRHEGAVQLRLVEPAQFRRHRRGLELLKVGAVHGMLGRVHGIAGVGVEQQELVVDDIVADGEGQDEEDQGSRLRSRGWAIMRAEPAASARRPRGARQRARPPRAGWIGAGGWRGPGPAPGPDAWPTDVAASASGHGPLQRPEQDDDVERLGHDRGARTARSRRTRRRSPRQPERPCGPLPGK